VVPRLVGLERVDGWVVVPRRPELARGRLRQLAGGKLVVPRLADLEWVGGWVVVGRGVVQRTEELAESGFEVFSQDSSMMFYYPDFRMASSPGV
jgi:hypothetical protein